MAAEAPTPNTSGGAESAAPRVAVDVLIVGAGIAGLTAAFCLERAGRRVLVVDRRGVAGGAIRTLRRDGWSFELGPNTVLDGEPAVRRLVADLDLEDERLTASPQARHRYLWQGKRLEALPSGPLSLLPSPLFSFGAKVRLLREPWAPAAPQEEESVADFVRRRLGGEILDRAVAPFLSGIHAGDPERLSLRWAMPKLHRLEQEHGSLLRGLRATRRAAGGGGGQGPAPGRGALMSFRDGQDTLPRRLAERLGESLSLETTCRAIESGDESGDGGAFVSHLERVDGSCSSVTSRHLVLTTPAEVTADLLAGLTGDAEPLRQLPYAPLAVVCLGLPRAAVEHPLDGFGFLVPRGSGLRLLGGLFASTLFPDRAPRGQVALSLFFGGATDASILEDDDDALVRQAVADLDRALGVTAAPTFRHVERWRRALPQLEVGHGRYVDLITGLEERFPGLHLLGSYRRGAAVPERIRDAAELAQGLTRDRAPEATAAPSEATV